MGLAQVMQFVKRLAFASWDYVAIRNVLQCLALEDEKFSFQATSFKDAILLEGLMLQLHNIIYSYH